MFHLNPQPSKLFSSVAITSQKYTVFEDNPLCCPVSAGYYSVEHCSILITLSDIILKNVGLKRCFQFSPNLTFVSTLAGKINYVLSCHSTTYFVNRGLIASDSFQLSYAILYSKAVYI